MTDQNDCDRAGSTIRPSSDLDRLFELLDDPLRRELLAALREWDDAVTIEQVTERIASGPGSKAQLQTLYHVHLPKLEAAGVVEFDRCGRTISTLDGPFVDVTLDAAASIVEFD